MAISASPSAVWCVLLDFGAYGEWNPFHRNVEIVQQPSGTRAVRMTVDMGPLLGTIVSEETIWYVDSQRHIFVYGVATDGPSCLRVVWLEGNDSSGNKTLFHSYDMIGGYPGLFSRFHIADCALRGFNAQHAAIKRRVESLAKASAPQQNLPAATLGRVLVTGGTGFLGAALANQLADLTSMVDCVSVIDVKAPKPGSLNESIHVDVASITDESRMRKIFERVRPDTVFHAASLIDLRPLADTWDVNVRATKDLLRLSKEFGARRFVYTSTIEVVSHYNHAFLADEETPYPAFPSNGYQETKTAAEIETLNWNDCNGMSTASVRPGHIFGDLSRSPWLIYAQRARWVW